MSGLKWTHKTTEKISVELNRIGIHISANTVGRLLKQMGFSLRVNHKKVCVGNGPDRDAQFVYIGELREKFAAAGAPITSGDTKKKELIGNFKNGGETWEEKPVLVNDHDFLSNAEGKAIPYGVYDVQANSASVFVGISHDTAEFAADAYEKWWRYSGQYRYPDATEMLILADGGGSNGARNRAWKVNLQEKLCDRHGLTVTVSHYPTGASKWNPVEHRLFSEISKNWAGKPLDSYQTVLNYLRTTRTSTGLTVKAYLERKDYETGVRISDGQMAALSLHPHEVQPKRNYTLKPR